MKRVLLTEALLVLLLAGIMVLLLYKKEPKDVPLEEVRSAVLESCDLTGLEEARDMRLKRAFSLTADDCAEYLYFAPANTMSVDEVLIVKTADPAQLPRVRAAIEARIDAEKTAFDGYGAEQIARLNEAKLVSDGPYIIYSCGPHADDFVSAVKRVIGR